MSITFSIIEACAWLIVGVAAFVFAVQLIRFELTEKHPTSGGDRKAP